jgi:transcriptional regulator with XRE-family HTH domain
MGSHLRNEELLFKISTNLKLLREKNELTQEDVYNDTGIHISRIESSKSNITLSTLGALCKYYKISFIDFFKEIDL